MQWEAFTKEDTRGDTRVFQYAIPKRQTDENKWKVSKKKQKKKGIHLESFSITTQFYPSNDKLPSFGRSQPDDLDQL
jgi:hypothetical protein